ncbi:hypothetical protein N9955_00140 [bacterium]|nr:hypothetical protein [bacterium]
MQSDVSVVVKEALMEFKKQSLGERVKGYVITTFAGATGALITLLLIGAWKQMDDTAKSAKKESSQIKIEFEQHKEAANQKFSILIDDMAKLKAHHEENKPTTPLIITPDDSLEKWEAEREMIQQRFDKADYRAQKTK